MTIPTCMHVARRKRPARNVCARRGTRTVPYGTDRQRPTYPLGLAGPSGASTLGQLFFLSNAPFSFSGASIPETVRKL